MTANRTTPATFLALAHDLDIIGRPQPGHIYVVLEVRCGDVDDDLREGTAVLVVTPPASEEPAGDGLNNGPPCPPFAVRGPAVHLGAVARDRRIAAGLTVRELAAASLLTPVGLGKIERGVWVPSATVIAEVFAAIAAACARRERLGDLGVADARVYAVMSSTLAAADHNAAAPEGESDDVFDLKCALDEIERLDPALSHSKTWIMRVRARLNGEPWYPGPIPGSEQVVADEEHTAKDEATPMLADKLGHHHPPTPGTMAAAELDLVRMHAGAGDFLTPAESVALLADRDRLAAEVGGLKVEHAAALDRAYDEGWNEGCGSAGADP